jgi:hypothetical protein
LFKIVMVNANEMPSANAGETVYVPVPRQHLAAVYQLLGRLAEPTPFINAVPWPTDGETPPEAVIDWSKVENCRRLRGHLKNVSALTLLDLTASKPGRRVYLEEVMAVAGCTHGQASAGNGALTKGIKKVFGSSANWPAPFYWDVDKHLAYYVMENAVAEAWQASASGHR